MTAWRAENSTYSAWEGTQNAQKGVDAHRWPSQVEGSNASLDQRGEVTLRASLSQSLWGAKNSFSEWEGHSDELRIERLWLIGDPVQGEWAHTPYSTNHAKKGANMLIVAPLGDGPHWKSFF